MNPSSLLLLGRLPLGIQVVTETPYLYSFVYHKVHGSIALSRDYSLLILDYLHHNIRYPLVQDSEGNFICEDLLFGYYDDETEQLCVEVKLGSELMNLSASPLEKTWKQGSMSSSIFSNNHNWIEFDLTQHANTGLFSFSVNVSTHSPIPFRFSIASVDHLSQLLYMPVGSLSCNKKIIAYGEASELYDTYNIILDQPRQAFSVFLEGKRMSFDYVENFGKPSIDVSSFLQTGKENKSSKKTIQVTKWGDLSSQFTYMRKCAGEEIMNVMQLVISCFHQLSSHRPLPSFYLDFAYTQTVKLVSDIPFSLY